MTFAHLPAVVDRVRPLAERFTAAGHSLYLVGGIVRDLWLDREPGVDVDLDLTTDALPDRIKAIVGPVADALWLQGERFGTVGARIGDHAYEITTHRAEIYRDDSRKPEVTFSTAIDEDLSRRDFTVNAMAVEVTEEALVDPFGGAADLEAKVLRTPLDVDISFTDDPLRMLRAARFAAGYGLTPDAAVVEAMWRLRERLDIVSAERIRDELDKLLGLATPSVGLRLLSDAELLHRFVPEFHDPTRFAAADRLARDPDLRLAGLFHGHAPDAVGARLGALRYSNGRRRDIAAVVGSAASLVQGDVVDAPSLRRWVAASGAARVDARSVVLAVSPQHSAEVERSLELESSLAEELDDLAPPLDGEAVMRVLGVGGGPVIGEALAHLQRMRFDAGPYDAAAAEAELRRWWASRETG
ncbi:MAG: CCA tRNA nucleotidyltransferase [Actinomycetota bacterium]